jgi:predicted acetyltransferase
VDADEALRAFPRIYERLRRRTTGFISRSKDWWTSRYLEDPEWRRGGAGPLNLALLELDGRSAGYAMYRIQQSQTEWKRTLRVIEALGADARATREIWRFLLGIDWMDDVTMRLLPVDHALWHLVARPRHLRAQVHDGLWVRLMDVEAALAARSYTGNGRVTLEVLADPLFEENVGMWTIDRGKVRRGGRRADVRLDVQALGSVYLGGFSFGELARADRVEEVARGGLTRAGDLFRTDTAPWCPEIF